MHSIRTAGPAITLIVASLIAPPVAAEDSATPQRDRYFAAASWYLGVPELSVEQATDDEVRRLFQLYMEARVSNMNDEADALAKQIVEVSIRSYGRESTDTARALTNLATLQASNDDNASAIKNYATAIGIVERVDSNVSLELVQPLQAMGAAQLQLGNVDHARSAWMRAVHVSHVNLGPHNFQQLETLQAMARLYAEAGMSKEYKKTRKRISYLRARYAELNHEAMIPGSP